MEALYRQGLNLVVEMLRSLENYPDFRADTSTLQKIALLANSVPNPAPAEVIPVAEGILSTEAVPQLAPVRNAWQTGRADPGVQKIELFEELRRRVLACTKCPHLVAFRHSVVFGVGDPNAELMFVGEAPGADEDLQGEPFVGRAGDLLTKIIQTMGYQRSEVFIANVLKCRPDIPPGQSGESPTHAPRDGDLSPLSPATN